MESRLSFPRFDLVSNCRTEGFQKGSPAHRYWNVCCRSTILSVGNWSGKISVYGRTDIECQRAEPVTYLERNIRAALVDDIPCNLRNLLANARSGDTITFAPESFPRDNPATIQLRRALLRMVQGGVIIDATAAAVVIDGAAVPILVPALVLASDNNAVFGLDIRGMSIGIVVSGNRNTIGRAGVPSGGGLPNLPSNLISGNSVHGIFISGDENVVRGNSLGADAQGLGADRNGINGIHIQGGKRNVVGGLEPGQGNLISGNGQAGVRISGDQAFENHLLGNFIGTDLSGTVAIPNGSHGVEITGLASSTNVGNEEDGAGNLISGNSANGIYLERVLNTKIRGNIIGADVDRTLALPNGSNGVEIVNSDFGPVGDHVKPSSGGCGGSCDLISGNMENGIVVRGEESTRIKISSNRIGLNKTVLEAIGNGAAAILITAGAHNIPIGGSLDTANVIGGNTEPGMTLSAEGVAGIPILGNVIGLGADTATPVGNQDGIVLEQGTRNNVIGPEDQDKSKVNIVSGNRDHGVRILGGETAENTVTWNYIGTTPQGHDYVGNGGAGVSIMDGAHDNTIGIAGDEGVPDEEDNPDGKQHIGNIIASNQVAGVPSRRL